MEFRKTVQLELEDHVSFSWFVLRKLLVLMLILVIVLVPVFSLPGREEGGAVWLNMLMSAGMSIALLSIIVALTIPITRHNLKKQLSTNRILQAPNEIVLNGEGVCTSSEFGNTRLPWHHVHKASEGKKAYYIYIAKIQAFIVPKRLLSAAEEDTLRALLQQHITPKLCRLLKRG
jgi:hypothetical protein